MPQQRQRGGRYWSSRRRGRTVDFLFCSSCGFKHRSSLKKCASPLCGQLVTLKARCGNCKLPREDPDYTFCRFCGLSYSDVGIVGPVNQEESQPLQEIQ